MKFIEAVDMHKRLRRTKRLASASSKMMKKASRTYRRTGGVDAIRSLLMKAHKASTIAAKHAPKSTR